MNKKGFTLVELLAVLVILGILVTIAVPAATSVGDKAKTKMLKTKTKLAMQGAILYLQDNKSEFTSQTNLNNCTTNNNVVTCQMTFLKLADLGQLDYDYTDDIQTFTAPKSGTYKLEVWGAQGGIYSSSLYGGYGGYSVGSIDLKSNINVYINRFCNVYKYVLQKNTTTNQYELQGLAKVFQGITGYEELYDNKAVVYMFDEHKIVTNQEF